ncbi:MAG: restriction endonuclease [Alphaproteobacteria bacterium]|nr:restriction endonuclease [Alphaproteobacteria bacterium]
MKDFIKQILQSNFKKDFEAIYDSSPMIQYLDSKMGAISGNTKTRKSLANIYAIYSLAHFYAQKFYNKREEYKKFAGFPYMTLFEFCRSQYGGEKLQNHGLNNRVNFEFANKTNDQTPPIIIENGKYLLNIKYLYVGKIDISKAILEIIEKYIDLLKAKDNALVADLEELRGISSIADKKRKLESFLKDDAEARIFEIIAFAVLKNHYKNTKVYFGYTKKDLEEHYLTLYKTGRTNANDGGIDFVMRPLGRFFQVTEVDNYSKYLLDIDKVLHFPITFVVKTNKPAKVINKEIADFINAKHGGMKVIKDRIIQAIEEIITINELKDWLADMNESDTNILINDIEFYYKMEMNLL